MNLRALRGMLVLSAALPALVACGGKSAPIVKVTGTNNACRPSSTQLNAGSLRFEFTNTADDVSEIYIMTDDDEVKGEMENVTSGATRRLTVSLAAGAYKVVCKPGQTGDGFSTAFVVEGSGGEPQAKPDRTIQLNSVDYTYPGLDFGRVTAGETIRFEMTNHGTVDHEFEILKPNGKPLGEIGPTDPDHKAAVTMTFKDPGSYTYVCGIEGHKEKGMVGTFTVTKP